LSIRTSPGLEADFLAWQPEATGVFTVRSAYRLGLALEQQMHAQGASSGAPVNDKPVWSKIWQCNVPDNANFCVESDI
jgi:hypothetical protein